MRIRAFLRKRLQIHVGLNDPSLPSMEAAADDTHSRGFFADIGIGNVLGMTGLALTLLGGYVKLNGTIVQLQSETASLRQDTQKLTEGQTRMYQRFNAEVVSRSEIDSRLGAIQTQQTQIYGVLLGKAGSK